MKEFKRFSQPAHACTQQCQGPLKTTSVVLQRDGDEERPQYFSPPTPFIACKLCCIVYRVFSTGRMDLVDQRIPPEIFSKSTVFIIVKTILGSKVINIKSCFLLQQELSWQYYDKKIIINNNNKSNGCHKDGENEMEWKTFLIFLGTDLNPHFRKAVQSIGESSERKEKEPLKSKPFEGRFQKLEACE